MRKTLNKKPIVLIYKRTHKHDPREDGIFGIENCMGKIREWQFDAVIGIGGKRPWAEDKGIAKKINWIGVGATKHKVSSFTHKVVTFKNFCLFEEKGLLLETIAPKLSQYLYVENSRCRFVKSTSLNEEMYQEVLKVLELAKNSYTNKLTINDIENNVTKIYEEQQCTGNMCESIKTLKVNK